MDVDQNIFSFVFIYINSFSEDIKLLEENKKEVLKLKEVKIQKEYEESKNSWIDPLNSTASISKSNSISDTNSTSKKVYIGFSQDVFRSGGIKYLIEYSDEKYKYDALSLQNERVELIYNIYDTVLEINKYNIQLKQNRLSLANQDIEVYIKKLQYEAGKLDLIELNNAIMTKNTLLKEKLNLKNTLNNKIKELSKYTDLKYTDIELLDFKAVSKDEYMERELSYNIQVSKEKMLKKSMRWIKAILCQKLQ